MDGRLHNWPIICFSPHRVSEFASLSSKHQQSALNIYASKASCEQVRQQDRMAMSTGAVSGPAGVRRWPLTPPPAPHSPLPWGWLLAGPPRTHLPDGGARADGQDLWPGFYFPGLVNASHDDGHLFPSLSSPPGRPPFLILCLSPTESLQSLLLPCITQKRMHLRPVQSYEFWHRRKFAIKDKTALDPAKPIFK